MVIPIIPHNGKGSSIGTRETYDDQPYPSICCGFAGAFWGAVFGLGVGAIANYIGLEILEYVNYPKNLIAVNYPKNLIASTAGIGSILGGITGFIGSYYVIKKEYLATKKKDGSLEKKLE